MRGTYVRSMKLRWDWKRNGVYAGYDAEGVEQAVVQNVIGPAGTSVGWQVLLTERDRALPEFYDTEQDGEAAAEIALRSC
jgi:hypothetical protein